MSQLSFGIDFGTTNCVVSAYDGSQTHALALDAHSVDPAWATANAQYLFPSSMAVTEDGLRYGWQSKLESVAPVEAIKRFLRHDEAISFGSTKVDPEDLAALFFANLRERASEHDHELNRAVVTVPANAYSGARYRTRRAASRAGIDVPVLLNEPTAAAISYAARFPEEGIFVVYDWGGGTFDVTVLEYVDGIFAERASRGVPQLGGIEVDAALFEVVRPQLSQYDTWSMMQQRAFALEIERAKVALSGPVDGVALKRPDAGGDLWVSHAEFESAVAPLVEATIAPINQALADAGLQAHHVDAVLMIGGSSHIPAARTRVAELFDDEPVSASLCEPMTAVARGASIACAMAAGRSNLDFQVVSSHTLGTMTKDKEGTSRFSTLIRRGMRLPAEISKSYTPNEDIVSKLSIAIVEGDDLSSDDVGDYFLWKRWSLEVRPPRPREEARFVLTYLYDRDGILHVSHSMGGEEQYEVVDPNAAAAQEGLDRERLIARLTQGALTTTFASAAPDAGPGRSLFDEMRQSALRQQRRRESVAPPLPTGRDPRAMTLVVDGSNLAWLNRSRRSGEKPSFAQLRNAVVALREDFPAANVVVVVDANLRHLLETDEARSLAAAVDAHWVIETPSGTQGGGDAVILLLAEKLDAKIVSNDGFTQWLDDFPWLDRDRILGVVETGGMFVFPNRRPPSRRPVPTAGQATSTVAPTAPRAVSRPASGSPLPYGWNVANWPLNRDLSRFEHHGTPGEPG